VLEPARAHLAHQGVAHGAGAAGAAARVAAHVHDAAGRGRARSRARNFSSAGSEERRVGATTGMLLATLVAHVALGTLVAPARLELGQHGRHREPRILAK